MNRKEFLKTTLALSALFPIFDNKLLAADADACEKEHKFRDAWVQALMDNFDINLTPEQRVRIMENNGRACARRLPELGKLSGAGANAVCSTLQSWIGKDRVTRNANEIVVVYDRCHCPLVGNGPARLSDTWCNCSVGWVKELFENAAKKPVAVELKQAIKRGDPVCRFVVNV